MNKSIDHQGTSQKIPPKIRMIFQNPPVLTTEDPALYWQFVDLLVDEIKPAHVVEWLHLKDIADYSWETFRIQRYKGAIVDLGRRRGIASVLRTLLHHMSISLEVAEAEVKRLALGWFMDPKIKQEVMTLLKPFGLTPDVVDAEAFLLSTPKLQEIDEILGIAAVRRDASMREIERRREAVTYLDPKKVIEAKVI